jgi:hypothetical protein
VELGNFCQYSVGDQSGLTWRSMVVMKIDLVGEKDRGLAMGLNEFAGYFAVGLVAPVSVYCRKLRDYPTLLFGIGISIGFLLTLLLSKTRDYLCREYIQ